MESKGFTVAVFNRTTAKVDNFVTGRAAGKNIIGTYSLQELADNLQKPRKVFMECLFGVHHPDSGTVSLEGKKIHISSPEDARKHGTTNII